MEGTGHQIIIDDINDFQAKFPGGQFALQSVSEHHDVALMEWQLILTDGTPVRGGTMPSALHLKASLDTS